MSRGKFGCLEKGLKDVTILILGLPLPREVTAVQRWTFTFFRARLSGTQIGNGISFTCTQFSETEGGTHWLTIQTYERTLVLRSGSIVNQIEKGTPLNFENNLTQIPYWVSKWFGFKRILLKSKPRMTKQKAFLVKPDDQKLVTMEAHQHHRQRLVLGFLTVSPELLADRVVANKV